MQAQQAEQSEAASDDDEHEMMQDSLEDRKYPGEVTTPTFKVKFQPKDNKKDILLWVSMQERIHTSVSIAVHKDKNYHNAYIYLH